MARGIYFFTSGNNIGIITCKEIIMIKVLEAISDGNIGGAGVLLCSRLKNSDKNLIDTTVLVPRKSKLIPKLKNIGAP